MTYSIWHFWVTGGTSAAGKAHQIRSTCFHLPFFRRVDSLHNAILTTMCGWVWFECFCWSWCWFCLIIVVSFMSVTCLGTVRFSASHGSRRPLSSVVPCFVLRLHRLCIFRTGGWLHVVGCIVRVDCRHVCFVRFCRKMDCGEGWWFGGLTSDSLTTLSSESLFWHIYSYLQLFMSGVCVCILPSIVSFGFVVLICYLGHLMLCMLEFFMGDRF